MVEKIAALLIFVLVYALMISEKVHRTVAVLIGAVLMVGLGIMSETGVLHYIQWEALGLLFGMFIIVAALSESGFFRWVGLHAMRATKHDPLKMFILFAVLAAVLAAFMDSMTVLIFMATLTLETCRLLGVKPFPFLLVEITSANIGGSATMVGDPPNIIIGTQLGLSFIDFVTGVGVIAVALFFANLGIMYMVFRKKLREAKPVANGGQEPFSGVKNLKLMRVSLVIFTVTVTLLVLHSILDVVVAFVGILGATLILLAWGKHIPDLIDRVDWHAIIFLAGLFVLVGGLEAAGLLTDLANWMVSVSGGNKMLIITLMFWVFAPISAFTDNVPFAAAMVPVIRRISETTGIHINTLAWTLAITADVSGNATPIGASANVVGLAVAKREGVHVSWKEYCKVAFPIMLFCILIANIMVLLFFL
ncbi:MAG: ArsB/NhaD family transporter [Euryarchaeota archaeon]|nr:ArsB/NhaD family transporter [Euryarchaeota archaeon]